MRRREDAAPPGDMAAKSANMRLCELLPRAVIAGADSSTLTKAISVLSSLIAALREITDGIGVGVGVAVCVAVWVDEGVAAGVKVGSGCD